MTRLLTAALLLAGCAPAPKQEPEYTQAQLKEVFSAVEAQRQAHIKTVDSIVANHMEERNKLVVENEALKSRVAELEKRCQPPAAHGPTGAVFQEEPR